MADKQPRKRRAATSCLKGSRYGDWTVTGEGPRVPSKQARYGYRSVHALCLKCGEHRVFRVNNLKHKHPKCVRTGNARSTSPTYGTWRSMKDRCKNPSHCAYDCYGGRGITVCPEWDSYDKFLEDMGERPMGKTLDRIDNDQGYRRDNCRWATPKEQRANQRPMAV